MLRCSGDANVTVCVVSTTIRYTHFSLLIYYWKRSCQVVTKTSLEHAWDRSFNDRNRNNRERNETAHLIRLIFELCIPPFL